MKRWNKFQWFIDHLSQQLFCVCNFNSYDRFAIYSMCISATPQPADDYKIVSGTSKQVSYYIVVGNWGISVWTKITLRSKYIASESCYYSADNFYDICIDIVSFDSPVCLCWVMNARADICFGIRDNDDYIVDICENIIHNNDSSK